MLHFCTEIDFFFFNTSLFSSFLFRHKHVVKNALHSKIYITKFKKKYTGTTFNNNSRLDLCTPLSFSKSKKFQKTLKPFEIDFFTRFIFINLKNKRLQEVVVKLYSVDFSSIVLYAKLHGYSHRNLINGYKVSALSY